MVCWVTSKTACQNENGRNKAKKKKTPQLKRLFPNSNTKNESNYKKKLRIYFLCHNCWILWEGERKQKEKRKMKLISSCKFNLKLTNSISMWFCLLCFSISFLSYCFIFEMLQWRKLVVLFDVTWCVCGVWTRYWLAGWTPLGSGRCVTAYFDRFRPLSPVGKLPLFLERGTHKHGHK